MKKTILTIATVAALAATAVAPAEAHGLRFGHRHGLGGGLGALGAVAAVGLAAGAIAAATDDYGYGYVGPSYGYGGPIFFHHHRRFW